MQEIYTFLQLKVSCTTFAERESQNADIINRDNGRLNFFFVSMADKGECLYLRIIPQKQRDSGMYARACVCVCVCVCVRVW